MLCHIEYGLVQAIPDRWLAAISTRDGQYQPGAKWYPPTAGRKINATNSNHGSDHVSLYSSQSGHSVVYCPSLEPREEVMGDTGQDEVGAIVSPRS